MSSLSRLGGREGGYSSGDHGDDEDRASGPVIRAVLTEVEQAQLARAREGVLDGLWERDEAGNWVQL